MGKNKRGNGVDTDGEGVSLNSLGNLHGRVDFFGIETKRANDIINKKLRILQWYVVFLTFVVLALITLVVLLAVRVDLFSPVNKDADNITYANTAAISSFGGRVTDNRATIEDLLDWKRKQTQATEQLNSVINDQKRQLDYLNSSISDAKDQFDIVTAASLDQTSRNEEVDKRLGDLDESDLSLEERIQQTIANTSSHITENIGRIQNFESFKVTASNAVRKLENQSGEKFSNVTKSITEIMSDVINLRNETQILDGKVDDHARELHLVHAEIASDLQKLNQTNAEARLELQQNISVVKDKLEYDLNEMKRHSSNLSDVLDQIKKTQDNYDQTAKQSFEAQNKLWNATLEKQREAIDGRTGRIRDALNELNNSVSEDVEKVEREFRSVTSLAKNATKTLINEVERVLEDRIERIKENMNERLLSTKEGLKREMEKVKIDGTNDTDLLKLQLVKMRNDMSQENEIVTEFNDATLGLINRTNSSINALKHDISELREEKAILHQALANISEKLRNAKQDFLFLEDNTTQNLIALQNSSDIYKAILDQKVSTLSKELRNAKQDFLLLKDNATQNLIALQNSSDAYKAMLDLTLSMSEELRNVQQDLLLSKRNTTQNLRDLQDAINVSEDLQDKMLSDLSQDLQNTEKNLLRLEQNSTKNLNNLRNALNINDELENIASKQSELGTRMTNYENRVKTELEEKLSAQGATFMKILASLNETQLETQRRVLSLVNYAPSTDDDYTDEEY